MPNIKFDHENKTVIADNGEWLYDVIQRTNIGIPFSCKAGACEHVQLKFLKDMII